MTSSQWRITSKESAGRHTTSYDSCGRYESQSWWNHVKLSSTRLCPLFSRFDYCNSLLYGINKLQLDMLQSVLRASARLIFRKRKFDSISLEIRDKLHWLPMRKRIPFKICTTVYKCLHGGAPPYLVEMLPVTDTPALRRLRSATRGDLITPSSKQFDLVREVSTFPGQPCGTLYRSTSDSANRFNHLRNNWKRFCFWGQTVAKKLY